MGITMRTKLLLICLTMLAFIDNTRGDASREYQVKAAMICNVMQFVEWPAGTFESESSPIVVTVVGENPFGSTLDHIAASKKIGGRGIVVKYAANSDKIERSQIVFVSESENANINHILEKAGGKGTLTIGEGDDFPWAGGIMRFYTEDGKLRFEINLEATEKAELKLSSKLLKLARIFKK
jgi:hypothetical protein